MVASNEKQSHAVETVCGNAVAPFTRFGNGTANLRMFAIWCDDAIHAIMRTHEAAEWLMDSLTDSDDEQAHTWSICPVSASIAVSD